MAYYAKVLDGKVIKVISCSEEYRNELVDDEPGTYIETFKDGSQRGMFAGVGNSYDHVNDRFLPPQKYDSWTFDEDEYRWTPPSANPGEDDYEWNEDTQTWDAVSSD